MTPYPSPEEVDAACVAARVPGAGISRMDMVAALEAAAEVRGVAPEAGAVAALLALSTEAEKRYGHPSLATWAVRAAITDAGVAP